MARHICAERLDHDADGLGGLFACGEYDQHVRLQLELLRDRVLVDELGDAAGDLALLVDLEPVALLAGLHLAVGQQLFNLLARQRAVRDGHGLDGLARERRKFAFCEQLRHIHGGQVDAEVGLVGAVGLQRVEILDAAEGRLRGDVVRAVFREDRREHVLNDGEHVVLRGERHLHIELIELAGAAVAAGVLIAEARRDLEVAVEARGHQQLLELLRGLRQGIELAGVLSRGNEIVARAFGAGGRQDRGRDLEEVMLHHRLAQRRDDVAAQDDVVLDRRVAEVEIAVFQALRLVGVAAAVDLKRQLVVAALAENRNLLRHDLDVAGGLLGVFAVALTHGAGDLNGGFLVDGLDDVHHVLGFDDDLRRAIEVAQDDEGEVLPDHADILHPAAKRDLFARIGQPELPAGVGSGLHHSGFLFSIWCVVISKLYPSNYRPCRRGSCRRRPRR